MVRLAEEAIHLSALRRQIAILEAELDSLDPIPAMIRLAEAHGRMYALWHSEQLHDDKFQQEPCFTVWQGFSQAKRQDIWRRMSDAERGGVHRHPPTAGDRS